MTRTVSADGLRWFCAMACACNKRIKGWDATCGYLQTEQRIPLFVHLPSHADYVNLPYEELAQLRQSLFELKETDDGQALNAFIKRHRPNKKEFPKRAWRLKSSGQTGICDPAQQLQLRLGHVQLAVAADACALMQCDSDGGGGGAKQGSTSSPFPWVGS